MCASASSQQDLLAFGEMATCLETRFFGYLFFLVCCWEYMRSPASKLTLQSILRSEPRTGSLARKWRVVCWIRGQIEADRVAASRNCGVSRFGQFMLALRPYFSTSLRTL
jgi:hypothetical protein